MERTVTMIGHTLLRPAKTASGSHWTLGERFAGWVLNGFSRLRHRALRKGRELVLSLEWAARIAV
jgi:hypothetical protein